MKVYIAGPMTGLPELNFPAFHQAARSLRVQGHQVINPAELNPDTTMKWEACMRRDLEALMTCDGVVVLPGWQRSRGARLEVTVAARLGMQVIDLESWRVFDGNRAALIHELVSLEPV